MQPKMAERAYRKVIAKGFSMFVWSRLLEFYVIANNVRASIACIAEVIDYFTDELGITEYPQGMPDWIQESIFKLLAKNGIESIEETLKQENCAHIKEIHKIIEKGKSRKLFNNSTS